VTGKHACHGPYRLSLLSLLLLLLLSLLLLLPQVLDALYVAGPL
jgi:hypothetical protein